MTEAIGRLTVEIVARNFITCINRRVTLQICSRFAFGDSAEIYKSLRIHLFRFHCRFPVRHEK